MGLGAEAADPEAAVPAGLGFKLEVEYFMHVGGQLPGAAGPCLGAV